MSTKRTRSLSQTRSFTENPKAAKRILDRCQPIGGIGGCLLYVRPHERRPRNDYATIGLIEDGHWRMEYVHRIMCVLYNGDIPAGFEVKHKCHQKRCCNPDHIEAVSASDHRIGDGWFQRFLKQLTGNPKHPAKYVHVDITRRLQAMIEAMRHTTTQTACKQTEITGKLHELPPYTERWDVKKQINQSDREDGR